MQTLQATTEEHAELLSKYDEHEGRMIRAALDDGDLRKALKAATVSRQAAEKELAELKPRLQDTFSRLAGATAENEALHKQAS